MLTHSLLAFIENTTSHDMCSAVLTGYSKLGMGAHDEWQATGMKTVVHNLLKMLDALSVQRAQLGCRPGETLLACHSKDATRTGRTRAVRPPVVPPNRAGSRGRAWLGTPAAPSTRIHGWAPDPEPEQAPPRQKMSNEPIAAALRHFYSEHNPSLVPLVPLVPHLIAKGSGEALLAAVWKKCIYMKAAHGPGPFLEGATAGTESAHAAAVTAADGEALLGGGDTGTDIHWIWFTMLLLLLLFGMPMFYRVFCRQVLRNHDRHTSEVGLDVSPVPDMFMCPISTKLMRDPVVTAAGNTYERLPITLWLHTHATDPLSNERLATKALVPNLVLRSLVVTWAEKHPTEDRGILPGIATELAPMNTNGVNHM